ncbi:MAG: DUF805 domain-containing protein [Flexibacteraceae bacterium]
MFERLFSHEGRISRDEYIVFFFGMFLANLLLYWYFKENPELDKLYFKLLRIPMAWFSSAQIVKRCHDVGKSGWWILVPFYAIYLLFVKGEIGPNKYGEDPLRDKDDTRGNF